MIVWTPPPPPRGLLEVEGGYGGNSRALAERFWGMRKRLGGGYWRLGMPLGLMLGYGNPFRAECGLEYSWGGGAPPPFK